MRFPLSLRSRLSGYSVSILHRDHTVSELLHMTKQKYKWNSGKNTKNTLIKYILIKYVLIKYVLIKYVLMKYILIKYVLVKYTLINCILINCILINCILINCILIKYSQTDKRQTCEKSNKIQKITKEAALSAASFAYFYFMQIYFKIKQNENRIFTNCLRKEEICRQLHTHICTGTKHIRKRSAADKSGISYKKA